jgi:spermidine synthase
MLLFIYFQDTNFSEPLRVFTEKELDDLKLRYYNADIHRAAFILPQFAKKVCTT